MDAVAELVKRESAVRKTAVYGLNSGAVSPMFSCKYPFKSFMVY